MFAGSLTSAAALSDNLPQASLWPSEVRVHRIIRQQAG